MNYYYEQGRIGMTMRMGSGFTMVSPGKTLSDPPTDYSGNPVDSSSGSSDSTSTWEQNKEEFQENREKPCPFCTDGTEDCSRCDGKKGSYEYVSTPNYSGDDKATSREWVPCDKCNGSGTQPCSHCNGSEKIPWS